MHVAIDELNGKEVVVAAVIVEQQSFFLLRLKHELEVKGAGSTQGGQGDVGIGT